MAEKSRDKNSSDLGAVSKRSNPTTPEESELTSQEWERRLMSGEDLPEDFLKVTDPKPEMAAANPAFVGDETGTLVDLGEPTPTVATASSNAAALSPSSKSQSPRKSPKSSSSPSAKESKSKSKKAEAEESMSQNQRRDFDDLSLQRPLSTEEQDRAMALALQEQMDLEAREMALANVHAGGNEQMFRQQQVTTVAPASMIGRLTVTVVEAKLVKNYGLTRMDPYCRLRIGHGVYETPTASSGSKEPKWNNTFNTYLLAGIKNIEVEIFDECTFTQDSQIAHATIPISEAVMKGYEVEDEWHSLSGNEGVDKEGMIHLIMSLEVIQPGTTIAPANPRRPQSQRQQSLSRPQTTQREQQEQRPPTPQLTEEEMDDLAKMFPNLDKEIITSVFLSSRGDKEATVNNLLQLGQS